MIDVLNRMEERDYEQVLFCQQKDVGLKAIIAIHNTQLGPALGGARMWPYESEEAALKDALRLARGMTYKAAGAGLPLGGGKAVIIGDSKTDKTPELFEAFGRFVQTLQGRYITSEDVGVNVVDVEAMKRQTSFAVGISRDRGGSGDPSPYTARGVYLGMKWCAQRMWGSDSLEGKRVAMQGVGNVGRNLIPYLVKERARVVACDIDAEKTERVRKEFGIDIVSQNDIFGIDCDIFSPCALGGIINDKTIPVFRCRVIAGGANNQLERVEHAESLQKRGIFYAPDYVLNAGGLINVFVEIGQPYREERSLEMINKIPGNLAEVVEFAEKNNLSTARAADQWVEAKLSRSGKKSIYLHPGS